MPASRATTTPAYSCLMVCGASARPLTLSLSAVLRKAGSWSWATLTSPGMKENRLLCCQTLVCVNGISGKAVTLTICKGTKPWNRLAMIY